MRFWFASLAALLMLILVLTACGNSGDTALTATTPKVTAAPASSPVPSETEARFLAADPEIKAVIRDFVSAQNAHDWTVFLGLWTQEEQKYYKDFFAYSDNEKNKNGYFSIKSAKLTDIREIENARSALSDVASVDLPYEIESGLDSDVSEKYGDFRLFIAKTEYSLEKEFWDYREGLNYRVFVLVPESGTWKVSQDYQWYPGGAEYFDDAVPEEPDEQTEDISEETDDLADGTVHYTKELDCYFMGLQWGDYEHMQVRTIEGDEIWFWMTQTQIDPETLTKYQKIRITWENRDKYIDEADRVINQDAVIDIKILN